MIWDLGVETLTLLLEKSVGICNALDTLYVSRSTIDSLLYSFVRSQRGARRYLLRANKGECDRQTSVMDHVVSRCRSSGESRVVP
jgi:hypothetical protein